MTAANTRGDPRLLAGALATYFVAEQFYTSLEPLAASKGYGYVFAGRAGAALLAAVIVASALACAYALARDGALARFGAVRRTPLGAAACAWVAATAVSAIFGFDALTGLEVAAMMALAGCFALALVRWYRVPGVARSVVTAYLVTGAVASLAGIAMVVLRVPRALYASSFGRAAGLFVTANQFAEFLEFFTFVALGFALGARDARVRLLAAASACAGALALALTFSRECWLGAAVAACFLAFAMRRRAIAAAVACVTFATIALVAVHPLPHHDPSDSFSRLRTLEAGLRVAVLFPLTGAGPDAFVRVYPAIAPVNGAPPGTFGALHPHDAYVSLAADLGITGLAAVSFGWFVIGRALARTLRARPANERAAGLGVCAALVAGFVSGLFDTIGVVDMTFVWLPYAALALATADAGAIV